MLATLKQTVFYQAHLDAGARMVDFAGWAMPVSYGSQIEEHHAVRRDCGLFDVSHMRSVDITGDDSLAYLRILLANDVARIAHAGQAMYSCLLNPEGGVIDDLIICKLSDTRWRVVLNAATAGSDLDWMQRVAHEGHFNVHLQAHEDVAMLALQGPQAHARLAQVRPQWGPTIAQLAPFHCAALPDNVLLARTGYTGEDGFEITLPAAQATVLWADLLQAGVQPCGLGARDTLRLEAGLNLYGLDMDESVNPFEAGVGWTVSLHDPEREFIGRDALEVAPRERHRVGLKLLDRGVMRAGMPVRTPLGEGEVTSGSQSPTLGCSVALARVPGALADGASVQVCIRGKWLPAQVVKLPFVGRKPR
ncbi:MAG: glycine cleavage system aminomethyltransferase GcvT [Pusillimonas sp.]